MKSRNVSDYQKCVEICAATDYGNPKSVRSHNRAAKKMYRIVEQAVRDGDEAVEMLAELLDEPSAANWLAFQLLEKAKVSPSIESRCLSIIESIVDDRDHLAEAYGARVWLKKWRGNKAHS